MTLGRKNQKDPKLETSGVRGKSLILASASASRSDLLARAGIDVLQMPANVDEEEIKSAMKAEGQTASAVAEVLAELKAQRVSQMFPEALVIGADQMLSCQEKWFDKPKDLEQAETQLLALQGKSHQLITSTCLCRGGARLWHHQDDAVLTMRKLSPAFVSFYLGLVGEKALESVGAYQIEGLGVQLFSQVEGDFFTIRGLCLMPLIEMLRLHKVVPT